jgi:hypothetical protein
MELHRDTTPAGFARYANEFLDAALIADKGMGGETSYGQFAPVPVMFLIGHSIELSLKSYLLHRGDSVDDVKFNYGHNLMHALDAAVDKELNDHVMFDDIEIDALEILNDLYATKQLNYIQAGYKNFPCFGPLESLAKKLLETVSAMAG